MSPSRDEAETILCKLSKGSRLSGSGTHPENEFCLNDFKAFQLNSSSYAIFKIVIPIEEFYITEMKRQRGCDVRQ